jgi:hypothetical protein
MAEMRQIRPDNANTITTINKIPTIPPGPYPHDPL